LNSDYRNLCARGASFFALATVVLGLALTSSFDAPKSDDAVQQAMSCGTPTASSPALVANCRPVRTITISSERRQARPEHAIAFAELLSQASNQ
jgi:hypothetical protein